MLSVLILNVVALSVMVLLIELCCVNYDRKNLYSSVLGN